MQVCKTCNNNKPLTDYSARTKDGKITSYFIHCKKCNSEKSQNYRNTNPELVKAQVKRSCEKHKDDRRQRDKRWYDTHTVEKQIYRKKSIAIKRNILEPILRNTDNFVMKLIVNS